MILIRVKSQKWLCPMNKWIQVKSSKTVTQISPSPSSSNRTGKIDLEKVEFVRNTSDATTTTTTQTLGVFFKREKKNRPRIFPFFQEMIPIFSSEKKSVTYSTKEFMNLWGDWTVLGSSSNSSGGGEKNTFSRWGKKFLGWPGLRILTLVEWGFGATWGSKTQFFMAGLFYSWPFELGLVLDLFCFSGAG